ncbi:MAG: hypothetical protein GXY88_03490 [Tissierellia bacterium]|nr:hypothetical protein [Tissierellia bacterium]
MSIRPVDYTNLITKSQEVAKVKQVENDKIKVQIEQGAVFQEKQIQENMTRVRDTNKSESRIVDGHSKKEGAYKKSKGNKKREEKKRKKTIVKDQLGRTIDIKI